MKAQCKKCGKWFLINKELQNLIEDGTIHPLDINLCYDCAEVEAEYSEYMDELECLINNM